VGTIGTIILIVAASCGAALAVLSVTGKAEAIRTYLLVGTSGLLLLAFGFIVYFHFQINALLPLVNPIDGQIIGTYKIPPWIEEEKLLFWSLGFSFVALAINLRHSAQRRIITGINILLVALLAIMLFASNPFDPLLPNFHAEIIGYQQALMSGDPNAAFGTLQGLIGKMMGFYNSTYMWTHPPLLFASYAAFGATLIGSIAMLNRDERTVGDAVAYDYGRFGFIALTLGLLLGYPWALLAWEGQSWWWDPKINMAIMMWVFYAAYLHARLYKHRPAMWTATAILGISSFAVLVLTYLTTYLIPGIHSVVG